jgi:hypothetical protein
LDISYSAQRDIPVYISFSKRCVRTGKSYLTSSLQSPSCIALFSLLHLLFFSSSSFLLFFLFFSSLFLSFSLSFSLLFSLSFSLFFSLSFSPSFFFLFLLLLLLFLLFLLFLFSFFFFSNLFLKTQKRKNLCHLLQRYVFFLFLFFLKI